MIKKSNKKTKNNKNNNLKKEKWCIFKDFTFQTVVERIRFHERFRVDGRQKRIKNHAFPNKSVRMEPKANMYYSGSSIVPCLSTSKEDRNTIIVWNILAWNNCIWGLIDYLNKQLKGLTSTLPPGLRSANWTPSFPF